MDLRQLRYFTETVHAGSISRAAKACAISQPSLSQQIMALEEELGEQLLERRPKGIELTSAGELLLHHAKRLLAEEAQMRQQFQSRGELQKGRVHFGIIPTLAPYLLPDLLGGFQRKHPGIKIEIVEDRTSVLLEAVVGGQIEYAILSDVREQDLKKYALHTKTLFREPLMLAVPSTHPMATRKAPPEPGELTAQTLIHLKEGHCLRNQTLKVCGVKSEDAALQCEQLETAIAMVGADLGFAVVPKLAVRHRTRPDVTFREFQELAPARNIYLLKRKGTQLSKAARELLEPLLGGEGVESGS